MRSLRAQVKNSPPLGTVMFEAQNVYHASPFAGRALRRIDPAEGAPRHFLSAMIRVKDEARFLPEWVAHHLNVGVEHVYVYDNNSSDDIERVIMPFIERGLVTYVPWPTVPASPSSNNHFLTELGPSSEWVAFFDADELLVEDTRERSSRPWGRRCVCRRSRSTGATTAAPDTRWSHPDS
ncbi:MAG TPA: glycosyltransferase family 2 protein [Jiangellaceae bacterium]